MELIQLNYFKQLAQNKNLTHTAELLNVTPSAISISISKLEKELGSELFDRVGRNMVINEVGNMFLLYVNMIFDTLEKASVSIEEIKMKSNSSITIGIRSPHLWSNIFNDFIKKYPDVLFSNVLVDVELHKQEIHKYPINHFFATAGSFNDPEWDSKTIYDDYIVILVPNTHRFANREEVDIKELESEEFIGTITPFHLYSEQGQIKQSCDKIGFVPNYVTFCEPVMKYQYVFARKNVAFDTLFAYNIMAPQNIVCLKIEGFPSKVPLALYWKKINENSPASCAFREFLSEYDYPKLREIT